jgi:hypothetical protein
MGLMSSDVNPWLSSEYSLRPKLSDTRNFDAATRRAPCLNLLALVVSGNYLLLYLLKICGVVYFMWYGPMERSVVCLQDFLK